jgi:DNA-binding transcriptional LysR family regulator
MLRTDPQVLPVLTGKLRIPPLPMWLAVHREIRTSQRIRAVYDYLAASLPELI